MKKKQKPLSFSLHPDNHAYIEAVVLKQKETNHRYNRSMYMDDLITHLRTKAKPKTELAVNDKTPVKRFVRPTLEEVNTYMMVRGCLSPSIESEKFCDHFESNGWKVGGKTKMVSWKAAVRNFLKGNSNGHQKASTKLSAHERVVERNNAKYRSNVDVSGLGVGADDRHMGRAVDEGKGRATIEHVDNEPFIDY